MALSQNLVQKQTQRLVITQDLRQSIELLPLSNLELSERIQKEILENPLLEERESESGENSAAAQAVPAEKPKTEGQDDGEGEDSWRSETSERAAERDFGSREYNRNDYSPGDAARGAERAEQKHQFIQNGVSSNESLADHLLWQLRMSDLESAEIEAGEMIISAIDERGFLVEPLEDLIAGTEVKFADASRALEQIHGFDPIGCGARDIPSSLLVQARLLHPEDLITRRLLAEHFEDLEKLDYKKIERVTGYSRDDIETSLQFVRTLEPYPGTLFAGRQPEYIVPDVLIVDLTDGFEVVINDDWLPTLGINDEYRDMLRSTRKQTEDREYLQTKLTSAQWLIKSIRQRRQTLYRVMKAILEFQEDFFRNGQGHLRPLTLRMVAEKVELHESTVSRITTNKYAQTRWGVFELKYFFSSSLRSSGGGSEKHSARSIQDRIRILVEEEDDENPLSDQEIMEKIKAEGVQIARRTVAKYRKILKILPADRRKKLKKLNNARSSN